jgi:hypothetical protein
MTVLATWKDRLPWPSSVVRALALSIFRSDGTAIELSVSSGSEETQDWSRTVGTYRLSGGSEGTTCCGRQDRNHRQSRRTRRWLLQSKIMGSYLISGKSEVEDLSALQTDSNHCIFKRHMLENCFKSMLLKCYINSEHKQMKKKLHILTFVFRSDCSHQLPQALLASFQTD